MANLEKFYPDYMYTSIWDIEEGLFKKNNIKYVVLDIDNTLVPYTTKKPTGSALGFLKRLERENIKFAFLSNNNKKRVKLFNKEIGAIFVSHAKKPLLFGMNKVMKKLGAEKDSTILIGDQVFTDIYTGNRCGVKTMLVKPIEAKETPFFGIKRHYERIVLEKFRSEN